MNLLLQSAAGIVGGPARAVAAAAAGDGPAPAKAGRKPAAPPPNWPPELAAAFEKIPTDDLQTAVKVCQELVSGGPATIEKLVKLTGDRFGDPNGVKPKYALHGVVHWASRPGAEAERKMVAETLARQLAVAASSVDLKEFVVRQLQFCGRAEETAALGALLTDERLCEPAAQALQAIGGAPAAAALRQALPKVAGKQRVTVLQALGFLKDAQAAAAARPAAQDEDWTVRLTALYVLASAGDAGGADLAWKAAQGEPCWQRNQATDACLALARRLARQGKADAAGKLLRQLLEAAGAAEKVHVRCAALAELAAALGAGALAEATAALDSKEPRYRVPAARTALKLAAAILKDKPQEATDLLKKIAETTEEKAVTQEARRLLAGFGELNRAGAGGGKSARAGGQAGRRSSHGIA